MLVLLQDLELLSRQARAANLQDLRRMRRLLDAAERLIVYALGPVDDTVLNRGRDLPVQSTVMGRPLAISLLQQQDRLRGTRTAEPIERLYRRFSRELRGDGTAYDVDDRGPVTEVTFLTRVRELLAVGDHRGSLGVCEAALLVETDPTARAELFCLRAEAARRLGMVDAALRDLAEAQALTSAGSDQQLQAVVSRCELLLQEGEAEQAAAEAGALLRLRPEADQLLLLRAAAHFAAGRPQAAVLDYQQVLERQPGRSDLLLLRAEAQAAAGGLRQALADIAQVLQLLEPDQSADLVRARCLRGALYLQLADVDGVSAAARDQLWRTVRDDYRALAAEPRLRELMSMDSLEQLAQLETRLGGSLLTFPLNPTLLGERAVG
jgi:tetratricopeptide (TPR) repeat protein